MVPGEGVHGPGGCMVPGVHGPVGVHGGDPPQTATAVGGTHPTGMHSCFVFTCKFSFSVVRTN